MIDMTGAGGRERPSKQNKVYLDHAGAPLPSKELLQAVFDELQQESFGNPHSGSTFSRKTAEMIYEARQMVLAQFNLGEEYEVIFTSGSTASLKVVVTCDCTYHSYLITMSYHCYPTDGGRVVSVDQGWCSMLPNECPYLPSRIEGLRSEQLLLAVKGNAI